MSNEEEMVDEALNTDPGADGDLELELAAQQDRVLRLQAEIQNLHSRQAHELADLRQYASIDLMRDILPVVDNIDRAIEAAGDSPEMVSLLEGFKLVRQQLVTVLLGRMVAKRLRRTAMCLIPICIRRSCSNHRPMCRLAK